MSLSLNKKDIQLLSLKEYNKMSNHKLKSSNNRVLKDRKSSINILQKKIN